MPYLTRRALGIDVGTRRVGLAISDATGTLARPLMTLTVQPSTVVDAVAGEVARLSAEDDGLSVIVVGLPTSLDGTATDATTRTMAFIEKLRQRTGIPIVSEDERLTSREAEQRLALRERDWRKRKLLLDAAAAAVFLAGLSRSPMRTLLKVLFVVVVLAAAVAGVMGYRLYRTAEEPYRGYPPDSPADRRDRAGNEHAGHRPPLD